MSLQVSYHGPDAEQHFSAYAEAFVKQFGSGQPLRTTPDRIGSFVGRILRGRQAADFCTLTDNPRRQVVFLTDTAALCAIVGAPGWELLKQIGYDDAFIASLLAQHTRFKLVVFTTATLRIATWDNLLDLTCEAYPDWRAKIEHARPFLKQNSTETDPVAAEVRAFLAEVLNVNRLYAGDGYTRREGDPLHRVHPEYVRHNCPLSELGSYCLIDFPVDTP